ncbi:hypothetical protein SDC9_169081 [bioreactor metagenome]|uniref:Uncharacterized protein n=1 Tax=bioreactor metagenome TaxID=1076179 RepID=A0A645G4B4_9ZZZZ
MDGPFVSAMDRQLQTADHAALDCPSLDFLHQNRTYSESPIILLDSDADFTYMPKLGLVRCPDGRQADQLLVVYRRNQHHVVVFLHQIFQIQFLEGFGQFQTFSPICQIRRFGAGFFAEGDDIFCIGRDGFPDHDFDFLSFAHTIVLLS